MKCCIYCGFIEQGPWPKVYFEDHICQPELPFLTNVDADFYFTSKEENYNES